jgi:hypothetical protein
MDLKGCSLCFCQKNITNFREIETLILLWVVNGATRLILCLFGYFADKVNLPSYLFELIRRNIIYPHYLMSIYSRC